MREVEITHTIGEDYVRTRCGARVSTVVGFFSKSLDLYDYHTDSIVYVRRIHRMHAHLSLSLALRIYWKAPAIGGSVPLSPPPCPPLYWRSRFFISAL